MDEQTFRELAELSGDLFVVLRTQPDTAVEFVLGPLAADRDLTADDLLGEAGLLQSRVYPDDAPALDDLLALAPGEQRRATLQWHRGDGRVIWTDNTMRSRARADGSVVLEWVARDITAQVLAERHLIDSEERHRLLVENAWDVIWSMSLDGTVTYVSPAVERVRGITPEEACHQTLEEIHPPESAARVGEYYGRLFAAIEAGDADLPVFRGEQEYYRKDGSIMVGDLQVIPHVGVDGQVIEILGVTRDVSERKRYEEELERLAVTDPLTGAWNRRHGLELIRAAVAEARRYETALSLLMIDVDHFKAINDTHGHQAGDDVLVALTACLQACLRESDILARWGGEEFVIAIRRCGLDDAVTVAEKLRAAVAGPLVTEVPGITVSIGAAQLDGDESVVEWLARADRALYEAKGAGRDRVVVAG